MTLKNKVPEDLPGYAIAKSLGYTLSSYTGSRQHAEYVKGGVTLAITRKCDGEHTNHLNASLHAYPFGLVHVSIDEFSFPNTNFGILERQITRALRLCEEST